MLVLVLVLVPGLEVQAEGFCDLTPHHTACGETGPGPACGGPHLARGLSPGEQGAVLELHNRLRAKLARGEEGGGAPGPQPGAADMRQMTWDPELAVVAQAHADLCLFQHDCADCRKVRRFNVGQNLYIYKQSLLLPENDWEAAVRDWYEEVTLFSKDHVEPFQFSAITGHYTALAWAETDRVGCGAASFREGKWFSTLYTCNYGPSGNYIQGRMYRDGPACSACPPGSSCSSAYPGLCSLPNTTYAATAAPPPLVSSILGPLPGVGGTNVFNISDLLTGSGGTRFTSLGALFPPPDPATASRETTTTVTTVTTAVTARKTTTSATTVTARTTTTTITSSSTTPTSTAATTIATRTVTVPTSTSAAATSTSSAATTTAPGPAPPLFHCGFEAGERSACRTRSLGEAWSQRQAPGASHSSLSLPPGAKSEFFFRKLIRRPAGGVACLSFRYRKTSPAGPPSALTVFAWPRRGRPGRVAVGRDSPGRAWVRAMVTFRNIDQQWLVMVRAANSGRGGALKVSVDDVTVTEGPCPGELRA